MLDAMDVPSHARISSCRLNSPRTRLPVHDNLINLDHAMVRPGVFSHLDYIYTGALLRGDPTSPIPIWGLLAPSYSAACLTTPSRIPPVELYAHLAGSQGSFISASCQLGAFAITKECSPLCSISLEAHPSSAPSLIWQTSTRRARRSMRRSMPVPAFLEKWPRQPSSSLSTFSSYQSLPPISRLGNQGPDLPIPASTPEGGGKVHNLPLAREPPTADGDLRRARLGPLSSSPCAISPRASHLDNRRSYAAERQPATRSTTGYGRLNAETAGSSPGSNQNPCHHPPPETFDWSRRYLGILAESAWTRRQCTLANFRSYSARASPPYRHPCAPFRGGELRGMLWGISASTRGSEAMNFLQSQWCRGKALEASTAVHSCAQLPTHTANVMGQPCPRSPQEPHH
ncbi:unnamed protein product [Pleuronectes platessa]|uniref:Uncharacterized protein n=1 Tax=Pleuronectes platessa TaxID=8262 RepID=A0A9N7W2I3_PLEPL|nr:unnamed protein product [Pleuronectes platessa]